MKPQPEYAIQPDGTRVMDDYRGDRVTGDHYRVTKFVPPQEITVYEVTISELGDLCTCPASRLADCKHRRMVREFRTIPHNVKKQKGTKKS
jgi:hypothetical protein